MYLLCLQFAKPSEKKHLDTYEKIEEALADIFGKTEITHFECSDRSISLCRLYASGSLSKFEAMELMRLSIIEVLHNFCGMGTYMFQSRDDDEIFCKIKCSDDVLLEEANLFQYKLQMNPELEEVPEVKLMMPHVPFDKQKYDRNPELFSKNDKSLLKNIDRIRLMERIIRTHVNLEMMIKYGFLIDFYPLHEELELDQLKEQLIESKEFIDLRLPIMRIRNYFGDKVAFYYIWLQFYTNRLFVLSYTGLSF